MEHFRTLDDVQLQEVVLTIGSFDGVHRGHQQIISDLTAGASQRGVPAVVLTFFPHPVAILKGKNFPYYLNTPDEKAALFHKMGVPYVITHPFNRKVANTPTPAFIQILKQHLNIQHIQVGYDFAMGKNRDGTFETLKALGQQEGFSVAQTQAVKEDAHIISSSRIRFLLGAGQVAEAATLLGRPYQLEGLVEVGDQRGRTIGFPTANLAIWAERIIPTAGVYACKLTVCGQTFDAVTNIGVRPTFETTPVAPRVEAHILDFKQDIYGQTAQLEFIARLRAEQRFPSVDALVQQIQTDIQRARKILA